MNIEQITREYLSSFFGQDLNECVDSLTEEHIAEAIASINLITTALSEQFKTAVGMLTPIVGPESVRQRPQTQRPQTQNEIITSIRTKKGQETIDDFLRNPDSYATPYVDYETDTANRHALKTGVEYLFNKAQNFGNRVNQQLQVQKKLAALKEPEGPEPNFLPGDNVKWGNEADVERHRRFKGGYGRKTSEDEKDFISGKMSLDQFGDNYAERIADTLRATDYKFDKQGLSIGSPLDPNNPFGPRVSTQDDRPSDKYYKLTVGQERDVNNARKGAMDRAVWARDVMPGLVKQQSDELKAKSDEDYKNKFGDHLDRITVAQNKLDLYNKTYKPGTDSSHIRETERELTGRKRLQSVGMDPNRGDWDDSSVQLKAFGEIERRDKDKKAKEMTMRDVQRDMMAYEQFIGYFTEQVGMYPRRTGAEISRESGWDRLDADRQIRAGRAEARREAGSLANNPEFQGIDTNDAGAVQGRAEQIMRGVQDRTRRGRSDEQIAADREAARQARIDSRPVRAVRKLEKDIHSDNVRMELTNRSRASRGLAPLPASRFYNLKAPRTLDFHGDEIQQYADMSPAERWSRRNGTFSPRPEPQPQPQSEEEFMGPSEEEYMKSIFPEKTVDARSLPGGENAPEGATTTWSGDSGYSTPSPPPLFTTQGIIGNAINRARQNGFRSTGSTPPVM